MTEISTGAGTGTGTGAGTDTSDIKINLPAKIVDDAEKRLKEIVNGKIKDENAAEIIPFACEVADTVHEIEGSDKKELAMYIALHVLELIGVSSPIILGIKLAISAIIEIIIAVSKGKFKINKKKIMDCLTCKSKKSQKTIPKEPKKHEESVVPVGTPIEILLTTPMPTPVPETSINSVH